MIRLFWTLSGEWVGGDVKKKKGNNSGTVGIICISNHSGLGEGSDGELESGGPVGQLGMWCGA